MSFPINLFFSALNIQASQTTNEEESPGDTCVMLEDTQESETSSDHFIVAFGCDEALQQQLSDLKCMRSQML